MVKPDGSLIMKDPDHQLRIAYDRWTEEVEILLETIVGPGESQEAVDVQLLNASDNVKAIYTEMFCS